MDVDSVGRTIHYVVHLTRLSGWSGEREGSERENEDRFDKHHCVRSKFKRRREDDTVGRRW